jgi:hypothetical protein
MRKEYTMNNNWKWALGITLAIAVLLVPPLTWRIFFSYGGYEMMRNISGWHMPMVYVGPGMMGFGMMFLMWLVLLTFLVLIGLGIAWLVKEVTAPKHQ